ncbi:RNA-directed DNA polymerase, eukaryota, reverse transcriptase zinc-binding domain protein [Tanacetum coccineum]
MHKKDSVESVDTLKFPPGFTPEDNGIDNNDVGDQIFRGENVNSKKTMDEKSFPRARQTKDSSNRRLYVTALRRRGEGSCYDPKIAFLQKTSLLMEVQKGEEDYKFIDLRLIMCGGMIISLGQKAKRDWIKELSNKNKVNFLSLQETKMESVNQFCIKSAGNVRKHNSTVSDYFVAIQGDWIPNAKKYLIISVYAPQEVSEKILLWSYLDHVIRNWMGETIIMGDFNKFALKKNDMARRQFRIISLLYALEFVLSDHRPILLLRSSLQLSHLFYADDVIFMGQWSEANIDIIVNALKCFHLASGLRMNLHKSKLMGIAIENDKIARAANKIGCLTLKSPFSYLGIKVGGLMSRVNSWDKVVDSLYARLSKWKMKTLSIGGRLTLLKSVLGSMPIYYMSLFKVPSQVLKKMEAIRSHFFNGAEAHENKMCWTEPLMIKWTWRFRNDGNSLWSKFIRAMYGSDGKLKTFHSLILPISATDRLFNGVHNLKNKNLDILSLMKKKISNGSDTSFWEEIIHLVLVFLEYFPRNDKSITRVRGKWAYDDLTFCLRRNPRDGAEAMQFSELKAILDGLLLFSSPKTSWSWSNPMVQRVSGFY